MNIIDLSGLKPPKLRSRVEPQLRLEYMPRARAWHWVARGVPHNKPRNKRQLKSRARSAGDGVLDIWIYDEIFPSGGFFFGGYGAEELLEDLENLPERNTIRVHLNSPGGDVFEGVAIYNLLVSDRARVETIVDGAAMSIASVISQAGDTRSVAEAGMIMIHNPWTFAMGEAGDLRQVADVLDKVKEQLVGVYDSRAGDTDSDFGALMDETTFFSGQESVDAGLADSVIANKSDESGEAENRGGSLADRVRRRRAAARNRRKTGVRNGRQVSDLVDPAVEAEVDRRLEEEDEERERSTIRGEVAGEMADGARVESSIMNEIINGDVECPFANFDDFDDRFDGMGEPIGLSGSEIRSAAESDGCAYGSTEDRSRASGGCKKCGGRSTPRRNRLDLATRIAAAAGEMETV